MSTVWFDHIITFTSAPSIDDYLKEYVAQGFLPADQTVRHDPGLRNGFIWFGPDYIEFCWVEDEKLFAAKATPEDVAFRNEIRPFEIGMIANDVQIIHMEWTSRGYSIPEIWAKVPSDAPPDTPPKWSFQFIPEGLLPGASCFVLTYHSRSIDDAKQIKIPPNTIYAVSGITFVTTEAEDRARRWCELLTPNTKAEKSRNGFSAQIGPHQAQWMTPDTYKALYHKEWIPASHSFGDIAFLNLLATDLDLAKHVLERAGRRTVSISDGNDDQLLIEPDPRDGFTFLVRQMPADIWLRDRTALTGEKLVIV